MRSWTCLTTAILGAAALAGCSASPEATAIEEHDHGAPERGPHGGRLFTDDSVRLELRIAEDDGPPIFLAYLYDAEGRRLPPGEARLEVILERFAGNLDTIRFEPVLEHLRGQGEVSEPHSFRATIDLALSGRARQWQYEQVEFRVDLDPAAVQAAGIVSAPAGPARIATTLEAPGEVRLNAERVLMVRPRFPGVVSSMSQPMGAEVRKGDVLAVIQSNESLRDYQITAPMAGTIVGRTGAPGAAVQMDSPLYTLVDLSSVWIDFAIHPHDIGRVREGQRVILEATTRDGLSTEARISYVGPLLEQDTRVSYARVEVPNQDGRWQPGLYVIARVLLEPVDVAVAVPEAAILRSRFGPAVFRARGSQFEIQPVETGLSDGEFTEIHAGLVAGDLVVVENAYLLKAELGRSEATHDH